MSLSCPGCLAREAQITDLRKTLALMQQYLRNTLGPLTLKIVDDLSCHRTATAEEVAGRIGSTRGVVRVAMLRLLNRGVVKHAGWKTGPSGRAACRQYKIASTRELIESAIQSKSA